MLHNYYIKTTNTKLNISDIIEKEYHINFHKTNFPTARQAVGKWCGVYYSTKEVLINFYIAGNNYFLY